MRQDKSISQRLKLRRAADAFDFNALIEGVSTLIEEPPREVRQETRQEPIPEPRTAPPVVLPITRDAAVGPDITLLVPKSAPLPTPEPSPTEERLKVEVFEVELEPQPRSVVDLAPHVDLAAPLQPSGPAQLRTAISTLSLRLLDEVARMGAAMRSGDTDSAGFYLAHTNQILELLSTIDPTGDLGRDFSADNAPPSGRTWPSTAWSIAEFAQSPFSALLPVDADEEFVQDLVYASWGVSRN